MHGFRPRRLLPLLLLPVLAGAGEPPGGLEQAKKELKELPTVRSESERARVRLPGFSAPSPIAESAAPPPAPLNPGAATTETDKARAAGNWLVDAMMKEEARTPGRRSGKGQDHPTDVSRTDAKDPLGTRNPLAATDRAAPEARDRQSAVLVDNPLIPFMADWITKRDQALLLPKPTPGLGDPRAGLAALDGPGGEPTTVTFRGIDAAPERSAAPSLRPPAENPFLQAVLPPETPVPAAVPSPVPVLPNPTNRALTPPEPAREARPPPPIDLSKPSQDAKYFPQLKRF